MHICHTVRVSREVADAFSLVNFTQPQDTVSYLSSSSHFQVMPVSTRTATAPGGVKSYYQAKIEAAEIEINQKTQNLRRLEAQRNALNARGRDL